MVDAVATAASDSREVQENLRAVSLAQKTELVGHIAGAIAHQFNNIMMAVTSYAELELKKAAPPQKRSLEQVLSNAGRATSLIQKLLAFSCKRTPSSQPLALNNVIMEINGLLQQLVGESIEIVMSLDPSIPTIKADHIELQQMILSLSLHAKNALSGSGKLTLSTEPIDLDKSFIGSDAVSPGRYVMVSIGHTEATIRKPEGHSASAGNSDQNLRAHLALTAVRGMVKEVHGLIRTSSSSNGSTNFKIYFPALERPALGGQEPSKSTNHAPSATTILVLDDDDAVRMPAAEFLMMEGFKVLQAKTGPEAIQIVERHRSPLDLLITDIVMPEMSGREVASKLLEKCPNLKILYMSGDADRTQSQSTNNGLHGVLQKPFRLNTLNETIHDLLKK